MAKSHIYVNGVGSYNGGAELLLRASSQRLDRTTHVVYADGRRVSSELRKTWDIRPYWSVPRLGRLESLGLAAIPTRLQRLARHGSSKSITALLDASGFSLGDQWDAVPMARTASIFEKLKRRGVPIVLLPQAFGPFTKPAVAEQARRIFEAATLVYARDRESLSHVQSLMGETFSVSLCPDITIALDVESSGGSSQLPPARVAIVPNVNLVSRGGSGGSENQYVTALLAVYDGLSERNQDPFFMLHSRHGDDRILAELVKHRPSVSTLVPKNGLEAKHVLSTCSGVVAGRYHAIVSALSQGVPAVAHSWSHKYQELLSDFGTSGAMADPFSAEETLARLDELLADRELPVQLLARKALLAESVEDLWRRVAPLVGGATLAPTPSREH